MVKPLSVFRSIRVNMPWQWLSGDAALLLGTQAALFFGSKVDYVRGDSWSDSRSFK
jgi:hypothetical protein